MCPLFPKPGHLDGILPHAPSSPTSQMRENIRRLPPHQSAGQPRPLHTSPSAPTSLPTPPTDLAGLPLSGLRVYTSSAEKRIWPGFMQRFRTAYSSPFPERDHAFSWLRKIPNLKGGLEGKAWGWMDSETSTTATHAVSQADTQPAGVPPAPPGSEAQKCTRTRYEPLVAPRGRPQKLTQTVLQARRHVGPGQRKK